MPQHDSLKAASYFRIIHAAVLVFCCMNNVTAQQTTDSPKIITLIEQPATKSIDVRIGEDLFTTYQYGEASKPFLHPVLGPNQIRMTRDFPIKKSKGEANDHPHHKSIWIGHEVNGLDFWSNKGGNIKVKHPPTIDADTNSFIANSSWVTLDGKTICTDETKWTFGFNDRSRWIDCDFSLIASEGRIEINDTKEGTVAIRTHPDLRLKPDEKRGVKKVFGKAFNSQGTSGPAIWGNPASWVAYTGTIHSKSASILLLDHQSNFRHPTTWHARDYGLVAANPFGLSSFQKMKSGAGQVVLGKGQRLSLRYRFVFFDSVVSVADCEAEQRKFQR